MTRRPHRHPPLDPLTADEITAAVAPAGHGRVPDTALFPW